MNLPSGSSQTANQLLVQAIQNEGYFDQATEAWRDGGEEWTEDYGSRTIPSSWGVSFQLGEKEEVLREAVALGDELDKLLPGLREELEARNCRF